MNTERIQTVIDGLKKLEVEKFNFSEVKSKCGTMHCVLGHLPTFFPNVFKLGMALVSQFTYPQFIDGGSDDVHEFFEISYDELLFLTGPNNSCRDEYFEHHCNDDEHNHLVYLGEDAKLIEVIELWEYFLDNRDFVLTHLESC